MIAYHLNGTQNPLLFYRYNSSGALTLETNWTGPTAIANGQEPRLSGGASGLFLAANEYANGASTTPTVLTVRKYTGTAFGSPVPIFNDPSASIFVGGVIG